MFESRGLKTSEIYFIVSQDKHLHYIFKDNILRFRISTYSADESYFCLTFVMRDNDRINFILSEEQAQKFIGELPHPGTIEAIILNRSDKKYDIDELESLGNA